MRKTDNAGRQSPSPRGGGTPKKALRPTLWKLGVVGLSGMGIFNFVVIVDTARKLWKFGVRTPMPIENARVAKDS